MQTVTRLSLLTAAAALALDGAALTQARAADLSVPQYQAPPPAAYGPPPVEEGYAYPPPPPPAVYAYPPPVVDYTYVEPSVAVVVPGPYYVRPYWRGYYGPHYAYGYGHWGRGWHRW